jgi:hypothetical protein
LRRTTNDSEAFSNEPMSDRVDDSPAVRVRLAAAGLAVAAREPFGILASIPACAVVLSLASAGGAGLLLGIYPAARASKLDPVEAMRTE